MNKPHVALLIFLYGRHLQGSNATCIVRQGREVAIAGDLVRRTGVRPPNPMLPAGSLSGGNQQKVVLAKWLAGQAEIFIFDEPTRGIDVGARRDIYDLMNSLLVRGAGIIMISSDLPEVLGMSDRILVMRLGRIQAEFVGADVSETEIMHAAFGVAS